MWTVRIRLLRNLLVVRQLPILVTCTGVAPHTVHVAEDDVSVSTWQTLPSVIVRHNWCSKATSQPAPVYLVATSLSIWSCISSFSLRTISSVSLANSSFTGLQNWVEEVRGFCQTISLLVSPPLSSGAKSWKGTRHVMKRDESLKPTVSLRCLYADWLLLPSQPHFDISTKF